MRFTFEASGPNSLDASYMYMHVHVHVPVQANASITNTALQVPPSASTLFPLCSMCKLYSRQSTSATQSHARFGLGLERTMFFGSNDGRLKLSLI
jgi:hypothetical protein